jgi:hypothetical protein
MTSATAGTIGGLPITSVTSASADTGNEAWRIWLAAPTGWRSGIGSYSTISPYNESSTQWVAVDFGANPVWITGYILAGDATCTIDAYCIEYSANASTWTKINASDVINAVIYNNPTTTTW